MGYTALYREWRPKNFDEVVGQGAITTTLKNQVKNKRIAHAYLFCGTRGTGKTSTSKILAKAVNCLSQKDGEPCNECEMCRKINSGTAIDVIEMDAASHNGVDSIRDLIDEVQYPPRESHFKVYILDEVHMLSQGAINAFLKTLEEPPTNTIFILATTDQQKLPVTILSRCQRFDFKRISNGDIYGMLLKIVKGQGIFADDRSLQLIAKMADGAMRDALSILDQAISMGGGNVDYDLLIGMLGLVTNEYLVRLMDAVIDKNIENCIRILDEAVLAGRDINNLRKDFILHIRNLMMHKVSKNPEELLDMSLENIAVLKQQSQKLRLEEIMRYIRILQENEEQAKWSKQSRIYLELALIKMCKFEYDASNEVILSRLNNLEEAVKKGEISVSCEAIIPKVVKEAKENKEPVEIKPVKQFNSHSKVTLDMVKSNWKDILESIKARRLMSIYAYFTPGQPVACIDGVVEIKFPKNYSFSKQNLEKESYKKPLEEIISAILKENVRLKFTIEDEEETGISNEDIIKSAFGETLVEIIDE